jgi:hypothetical protein
MVQAVSRRESLGLIPVHVGLEVEEVCSGAGFIYHYLGSACELLFHQCSMFILQSLDSDPISPLEAVVPKELYLLQPKNSNKNSIYV